MKAPNGALYFYSISSYFELFECVKKIVSISYPIGIFGIGYYKELGVMLQMRGGDSTNHWG